MEKKTNMYQEEIQISVKQKKISTPQGLNQCSSCCRAREGNLLTM